MMANEQTFDLTLTLQQGFQFVVDFQQETVGELVLDEPPPLGENRGPNAARLLAAAVGNCLGASLLFCLQKAHIGVPELRVGVEGTLAPNDRGRLRIREISVKLEPGIAPEHRERLGRCLEIFEDFCLVTQSVRQGIQVNVEVAPVDTEALAAPAATAAASV